MAAGVFAMASNSYDEFRGVTRAPSMRVGRGSSFDYPREILNKKGKPEDFHNAMTYHWAYASMILFAGIIAFKIDKGQEHVDPMSPDSDKKLTKNCGKMSWTKE
jgi:hypothetical protein